RPRGPIGVESPDPPEPMASAPRGRLDHTITLGGVTDSSARAYDPPAAYAGGQAPTIVNVYVNQMPGYGYGGYGAVYGVATPLVAVPRVAAVRAQSAPVALRPGLDWPAVPNHGPAFPYRTGPASPWDGADPRRR